MSRSEAEDSQNLQGSEDVQVSAGTSPESSSSFNPGSPSDHGLPPAATRTRKRKNLDDEDEDFVPSEVKSSRKERVVVNTVSATTAAKRGIALTHAEGSSAKGQP